MRHIQSHRLHAFVAACMLISLSAHADAIDSGSVGRFITVGEHMFAPPPDPAGTTAPQPTGDQLRSQVQSDLKRRFDALADPATHLLTAAQARAGAWGYVVDHFKEIDQSRTGHISYEDIVRFLQAKKGPAFSNSSGL